MQDGDVVTMPLNGSRTCFHLKQKSGCVDAAPAWEWATYDHSLLLPLLLLSFSLIRAHLCFLIKFCLGRDSEKPSLGKL